MAPKLGHQVGIRQQLDLPSPKVKAKVKAKAKSALDSGLINLYRKGKLSARDVGDTSAQASSSPQPAAAAAPDILRLSKAKANPNPKKASRNSSRALMRAIGTHITMPPVMIVQAPMWDKRKVEKTDTSLAVMPIHETLAAVCAGDDGGKFAQWSGSQAGYKSELRSWGGRMNVDVSDDSNGPWVTLGIWGDGADSTNNDSLQLLSFTVLCGLVRQRFWVTAFNKSKICQCGCKGKCTFAFVFGLVAWSAAALLAGRYPDKDHTGKAFPKSSWRGKITGKPLGVKAAIIAKYGGWA